MLKNGENPFKRDTLVHRGKDSDGNVVEIFKTTFTVPKRTKDNGRRKMADKNVGAATYRVVVHVPNVKDRWLHIGANDEPLYLGNDRANLVTEMEARLKA